MPLIIQSRIRLQKMTIFNRLLISGGDTNLQQILKNT